MKLARRVKPADAVMFFTPLCAPGVTVAGGLAPMLRAPRPSDYGAARRVGLPVGTVAKMSESDRVERRRAAEGNGEPIKSHPEFLGSIKDRLCSTNGSPVPRGDESPHPSNRFMPRAT